MNIRTRKTMYRIPIVLFSLLLCFTAFAKDVKENDYKIIYKWTDQKGHLHLTDYPPPYGEAQTLAEIKIKNSPAPPPEKNTEIKEPLDLIKKFFGTEGTPVIDQESLKSGEIPFAVPEGTYPCLTPAILKIFSTLGSTMIVLSLSFSLFCHLFYGLSLYLMSKKVGLSYSWLSFVPLLNIFPLIGVADKPLWWIVFFLLPVAGAIPLPGLSPVIQVVSFVSLVIGLIIVILLWVNACKNLGSSKWLALVLFIPFFQFFLPAYLGFKGERKLPHFKRLKPALITFALFAVFVLSFSLTVPAYVTPLFQDFYKKGLSTMKGVTAGSAGSFRDNAQ